MWCIKRAVLVLFVLFFVVFFRPAEAKAGFWDNFTSLVRDIGQSFLIISSDSAGIKASTTPSVTKESFETPLSMGGNLAGGMNNMSALQVSAMEGKEQQDVRAVEHVSVVQLSPPSLEGGDESQSPIKGITYYTVKERDTVYSLADRFDLSVETLCWANETVTRHGCDLISAGDVLTIPPINGVIHVVKSGDTLTKIADLYRPSAVPSFQSDDSEADFMGDIVDFNDLEDDMLIVGVQIVVPYGKKKTYTQKIPTPKYTYAPTGGGGSSPRWIVAGQKLASSDWLIAPTSGYNQKWIHSNNGVDVSNPCGTPIYAAAQGVVSQANITESRSRFALGGYGTNIKIAHKNGTTTLYAHLQKTYVNAGEAINQGDLIALMGGRPGYPGSGRSTGCHLHFEVRGAANPLAR